jgi:hypothetical protein
MKKVMVIVVAVYGLACGITGSYGDIVDDDQVGFVIGGKPDEMAPTKPNIAWDICGPIATKSDVERQADCIARVNAQGVGYMAYFGLAHIESKSSPEEVAAEFAKFDLDGEGRKVDINGVPKEGDIGRYVVSTHSRAFLETVVQVFENMIDAGAVAVGVDEGFGSSGPGYSSDFHPEAVAGFREFLKKNFTSAELKARWGIKDIDRFDYRKMLQSIHVVVDDTIDPTRPSQMFTPEWWKERMSGHGVPFDREWQWYRHEALAEFHKELIERSKAYARLKGREWHVYINIYTDLGDGGNIWKLAEPLDIIVGETWPKYPRERLTSFYKNVRSRNKRFWSMDWPGQELPPRSQADNGLIATFIAEAYVNGCYSRYPQKLDKWPGVKAKVDPYFAFVRGNEGLFVRPDAEIGLFYSLSNCAGTLRREGVNAHAYHAAARLLEDAHRSYEVIFAGNDTWVPYDLTLEDIKSYKLIVLPHIRYMSQTQREMILDYRTNGGIIVTMGDIGTHNLDGAEYPLTEWNNLFEKGGSHRHGKGRIYHFADTDGCNLAEHYGYGRKRKGKLEDLKRFSDVLKSLLPPRLKTNLPSTVAVHRNVNPSNGSIVLHLLNYDYDAGRDQIRPVNKASLEITLPESMPAGNVRAVYYELANLPNGKLLKCKAAGEGAVTVVIPRVSNWGTLVIEGTKR